MGNVTLRHSRNLRKFRLTKISKYTVACETIGGQVNYLINEGEGIGKGANATVSLIQVHGLKEDHLLLHADNCVGWGQEQYPTSLSSFSCLNGVSQIHHTVLHVGRSHKICAWSVIWFNKVNLSTYESGDSWMYCQGSWELISDRCKYSTIDYGPEKRLGGSLLCLYNNFRSYFKDLKGITSYHIFHVTSDHPGSVCATAFSGTRNSSCANEKDASIIWFPPADCAWRTRPETATVPLWKDPAFLLKQFNCRSNISKTLGIQSNFSWSHHKSHWESQDSWQALLFNMQNQICPTQ